MGRKITKSRVIADEPSYHSGDKSAIVAAVEIHFPVTLPPITMPLGIRPINDFAFKKTFGSPENRVALISLLNAILDPKLPLVDITLENPYNLQDFQEDKLSILDIKAVDRAGAIYDIEMQLANFEGLVKRIVFYGCELYVDQLRAGDDYAGIHPVYSICLLNGILWPEATKVHHAFRLADSESGRVLDGTVRDNFDWRDLRGLGKMFRSMFSIPQSQARSAL